MVDLLSQTWQEITSRPDGPLAMRFYLQPLMATLLAARDGVKDAREGNSAYLWAVVYNPAHRRELLRNGWRSIGKVFVIALVLDVVYQVLVLRELRPLQGLIVAVIGGDVVPDTPAELVSQLGGVGDDGDTAVLVAGEEPERADGRDPGALAFLRGKVDDQPVDLAGFYLDQVLVDEVKGAGLDR